MNEMTPIGARAHPGRSFAGPLKYIQQAGEITRLGTHVERLGRKAFVLVDRFVLDRHAALLDQGLASGAIESIIDRFGGECCQEEIDRVTRQAQAAKADILVGVGGGKTLDTAKMAAVTLGARIVTVPTIASTDAPCSAIAVRYTAEGIYQQSHFLPRNPDAVIVDSALIAKAPARFLASGIGDALSTFFEARSHAESRFVNLVTPAMGLTTAGLAIAKACHDVLMRDGVTAMRAIERGALTQAVENIIEANTLLSGLGFENCGVSAAHGIHDGLTVLDETHGFFHGEKVAFGVLCLLMLEGRAQEEIADMVRFCRQIGLPTTLADLGLANVGNGELDRVAAAALSKGSAAWCVAVPMSIGIVRDAILALDEFSRTLVD